MLPATLLATRATLPATLSASDARFESATTLAARPGGPPSTLVAAAGLPW